MTFASEFSIGIYAPSFPRDPLHVNVYLEHVLLGQIIEPLFTLGDDGLIKGGVAERWEYNKDKTELTVYIRKGLQFSNGQLVTSEDVKFSIERHHVNPDSQSFNYLKIIKNIEILSSNKIKIILQHKYLPFILTLSRDHLGILPHSWEFNPNSQEPYIGTGPYKIIKDNNNWYLDSNPFYRSYSDIKIKRWKVDIIDTASNLYPKQRSDLFLLTPKTVKEELLKKYDSLAVTHQELNSFSFVQYSFWWLKEKYKQFTLEEKSQIRSAITLLSEAMAQTVGGELSTGVIPIGISGSLAEKIKFNSINKNKILLNIIVPQVLIETLENLVTNNKSLKDSNVTFKFTSYSLKEVGKVKESTCEMALISYAGGFFDPEGYLSVLPSLLGRNAIDIFGGKAELLRLKAESEFDGSVRSELYRQFSLIAQEEVRYVPGWVPTFSEFRSQKLKKKSSAFKYGHKLIDYEEE